MKKLLVSDISHTIYLANAKKLNGHDDVFVATGKKEDFTDEAIKAVFQWFVNNFVENEPNEVFEVAFKNSPYVLQMVKKDGK